MLRLCLFVFIKRFVMKKIIFSTLLLSVLSFGASAQTAQKTKPQATPKVTTAATQKPSGTTVKKNKEEQTTVMTRPKHRKHHSHKSQHKTK